MSRRGSSLLAVALTLTVPCLADDAAAVFAHGQAALAAGDLDAAETDFRSVLRTEPQSVPARANLGVVFMRRKNWSRALDEFRTAERLAPNNPGIELNIGLAYFHQADYAAAVKPLQAVVQSDPNSAQARYLLGLCDFGAERYPEAVASLKPLWPAENGKMAYLYVLALAANKAGEARLEQQALEQMFQVGNGSAEYHLFLGRAWLLRQRDVEARKELMEAARLNPKLPFVHYSLATIYAGAGEYAQAKAEFAIDAGIEPDLALDQEQLGEVSLKLDQPDEAAEHFRRALALDPRSAPAYLALAKIEKAKGHYEAALVYLNAASKLDQQSASVHYLRGQVLAQLNRPAEAKRDFALSAQLRKSTRDRLEEQVSGRGSFDAQLGLP